MFPIMRAGWMILGYLSLALCACDKPMSYDQASQQEPYRNIADSTDRRWLYDYHQTPAGAMSWLEDEIRLNDNGIVYVWGTSDGLLELEYAGDKNYSIKREKAIAMVRSKGAPAAAREILSEAHKKVGGYATAPDPQLVLISGGKNWRRAQRLTYPQAYERTAVLETQKLVDQARQAHQAGDAPRTLKLLETAIEQRQHHLAPQHPATLEAMAAYQAVAGRPYAPAQ